MTMRAAPGWAPASLVVCLMAAWPATPATAQEVRAAVVADSVRVGDVVPVAVRAVLRPGQRAILPDTLPLGGPAGDLENAARVRLREDTLADGAIQVTGLYSVTPWRPGDVALPDVAVEIVSGDEQTRTLTARLPAFAVISVLPEDTAGIQPKPAKGVIGASWSWWPILLALLALLLVAGLVAWLLWRRRRRAGSGLPFAPALPPRDAALAALDRVREERLAERGEMKEFYTRMAAAVREYLGALEPGWGEDRTTTEVLAAVRALEGPSAATTLGPILRAADQVKFARRQPSTGEALADWEAARAWVVSFRPPPEPDVEEAA